VQSEHEVEPRKPCFVLLAAVAIPTACRDPEGRQDHKLLHDCPPSKRSHDTIALYQGDVARHRICIVCISEARDAGLVTYHLRKTAMSWNRRGKAEGQVFTPCATPLRASSSLTWDGRAPLAVAGLAQRSVGVGDAAAAALSVELRVFDSRQNATLQV